MDIQINGQLKSVASTTVEELVSELGLSGESLVVEHNGRIIRHEQYKDTRISESDVLELLNFVGGG